MSLSDTQTPESQTQSFCSVVISTDGETDPGATTKTTLASAIALGLVVKDDRTHESPASIFAAGEDTTPMIEDYSFLLDYDSRNPDQEPPTSVRGYKLYKGVKIPLEEEDVPEFSVLGEAYPLGLRYCKEVMVHVLGEITGSRPSSTVMGPSWHCPHGDLACAVSVRHSCRAHHYYCLLCNARLTPCSTFDTGVNLSFVPQAGRYGTTYRTSSTTGTCIFCSGKCVFNDTDRQVQNHKCSHAPLSTLWPVSESLKMRLKKATEALGLDWRYEEARK